MEKVARALVPARGGSKGIKRKNLLPVDGVPLFIYAAEKASEYAREVWVSSDSDEILALAELHGLKTMRRPDRLATDTATIDDVVEDFRQAIDEDRDLLVWQPTVVLEPGFSIAGLVEYGRFRRRPVALAQPTHGVWNLTEPPPRVNRQSPSQYTEIGLRFYPAGTMSASPEDITEVDRRDRVVDIDTWAEYERGAEIARNWPRRVVYEAVTGPDKGMGHLFRVLSLAEATQGWDPKIVVQTNGNTKYRAKVVEIVEARGFKVLWGDEDMDRATAGWPRGVWVLDTLDTEPEEVMDLKVNGWRVLTLEDQGRGALYANTVINAMYAYPANDRHRPKNLLVGPDYAVIRPEFLARREFKTTGDSVLVTFGGTDPANLTEKVEVALGLGDARGRWKVNVIEPPGRSERKPPHLMALEIATADVVVCSGGRTVYEAAAMGKPTVVLTQNFREDDHVHLGHKHGVVHVGYGPWVGESDIVKGVEKAFTAQDELGKAAKRSVDGRGIERIVREIERLFDEED